MELAVPISAALLAGGGSRMSWLVAVVLVGLPLLSLLADLTHRDLARTLAAAQAALRETEQER